MFEQTKKSVSTARPMAGPSRIHSLLGWGQYAFFAIVILANLEGGGRLGLGPLADEIAASLLGPG